MENLDEIVDKGILKEINPVYKRKNGKSNIIIPYYGNSIGLFLALKSSAVLAWGHEAHLLYPEGNTSLQRLEQIFRGSPKEHQKNIAYSLSHELKVSSLALGLAMQSPDVNVFEIGCDIGLGSLFYANKSFHNIPKEGKAYNIRAFESDETRFNQAMQLKSVIEESKIFPISPIEYKFGEGVLGVENLCNEGDIIFASMAEPDTSKGVLKILENKRVNLVTSYSELTAKKIKEDEERFFDKLIPNNYEVRTFEDSSYNLNTFGEHQRFGIIVRPK